MSSQKIIGKNLKALRCRMQLSPEMVAAFLNIRTETLQQYEAATRTIPTATMALLADLYHVDCQDLGNVSTAVPPTVTPVVVPRGGYELADLRSVVRWHQIVKDLVARYPRLQKRKTKTKRGEGAA